MFAELLLLYFLALLQQICAQRQNCPPGTYASYECLPCPMGTFNPSSGATSEDDCKPCSPGTFAKLEMLQRVGAASCTLCPPGTFSERGAGFCRKCPEGTFARNNGTGTCTTCPRGRVSRPGYTRCLKGCPPGKALSPRKSKCSKCQPGTFRPRYAPPTKCLLCRPGTTSSKGSRSCSKCPKGTFRKVLVNQETGIPILNASCTPCETNTFADVRGLETCKLCPLGTVSNPGAKKCKSCPAGTFRSQIESFPDGTCTPCSNGTISLGKKPAGCKHPERGCPVNTFEDENGECRACMPGQRLEIEAKRCVPCGRCQVSPGGVTTDCETCPRGQRPADSDSIFEKSRCECLPGTESDKIGGCRSCRPGTHWRKRGRRNGREMLPPRSSCVTCESGTFQDEPGMAKCEPCPFETYTNSFVNFTSCTRCPAGTTNTPGDANAIDNSFRRKRCTSKQDGCPFGFSFIPFFNCKISYCPPGTLYGLGEYFCGNCAEGEFLNGTACADCPEGQTSAGGLITECIVCPEGAIPFSGGICSCIGQFGDDGRGGCKRCPKGQISITGNCGSCPEGSIPRFREAGAFCHRCGRKKVRLPGESQCRLCPKGFVKDKDLFGFPVNRCVPADLLPIQD